MHTQHNVMLTDINIITKHMTSYQLKREPDSSIGGGCCSTSATTLVVLRGTILREKSGASCKHIVCKLIRNKD